MNRLEPVKPPSIAFRIRAAKTLDELKAIFVESGKYKFASEKTRRNWKRIFKVKEDQLKKGKE